MLLVHIGEHIIHFDQLPSTNAYAAELLSKSKPVEGTVITTDNQYAGKGQIANKWESAPNKNVSLSIVLYPSFLKLENQFRFNQAISIAVYHTVDAYLPGQVKIKWPNDIYILDHKVAGILIQNQIRSQSISSAIVGIGINVNQDHFESDAPNPISIYSVHGKYVNLQGFKNLLFENLSLQYHALSLGEYRQLDDTYHDVLYRKDEYCKYRTKDGLDISGTITGVGSQGLLHVLIDGRVHEFGHKEIQYL